MKYRKLRIAWSVAWGVVAALLLLLWVRSYWQVEHVLRNGTPSFCVSIYPGQLALEGTKGPVMMPMGWSRVVFPVDPILSDETADDEPRTILGFGWQSGDDSVTAYVPFWFLALSCAVFTWFGIVPPPFLKQFSLRNLLLAITLLAVALGAVAYLTRRPFAIPPLNGGDSQDDSTRFND